MSDELTLYPIAGCGRCADIVAAHMLTFDPRFYAQLASHLDDHEMERVEWPDSPQAGPINGNAPDPHFG